MIRTWALAGVIAVLLGGAFSLQAGVATNLSGLYYSGINNGGGLLSGGSTDPHWTVTYARVNGSNYNGSSTYTGAARVVSGTYIDYAWTQNTSTAQWITAPGAMTAATGGTVNIGGDYLPGNGTTGSNRAQYIYTLAFPITGTGSGTVTNDVSINLTIAADDQYKIYVNPVLNSNGSVNTGSSTLAASRTNAWNNTTAEYLQNYSNSNGSDNANFVIGTNYIVIVVDNTNSKTGDSGDTDLNPSGLLVYQVGSAALIDGTPVPEAGTWLPLFGAVGLYGMVMGRRRRQVR